MEVAVMHGVARVMVKDYGQKRHRDVMRQLRANDRTKPKVNYQREWERLVHDSATKYGIKAQTKAN